MRITGLATGLDMDEVIKESMRPYRVKIQQQQQQKEIVESFIINILMCQKVIA